MNTIKNVLTIRQNNKSLILDAVALAVIYFIPALSHLFSFPLYYVEPMRIMVILAIAHTSRRNAYLLALTLPIFSMLVSGHPVIYKSLLMSAELVINVFLFYFISKKIQNQFFSMFISIILSKVMYYAFKFVLIGLALLKLDLISTPLLPQLIVSVVISAYLFLVNFKEKSANSA